MQMAATAQNGRDYLLLELLPKIQDDNLWNRITRDLFEQKDRHHLWRLEICDRFAKLTEDDLNTNCYNWTIAGTGWLQQITLDIRFATQVVDRNDWDRHILQDFMNLLAFIMRLFHGTKECLGKIAEHCENMASSGKPVLGDVAKEFKEWRTYANNSFRKLVDSLSYHEKWDRDNLRMNLQEGDKVPGATFTELLIRNEIQKKWSKIVSRPMEMTQPDTRHVSGVDHQNATKEICKHMAYLVFLSDITQPISSRISKTFIGRQRQI